MSSRILIFFFLLLLACSPSQKEEKVTLVRSSEKKEFHVIQGKNESVDTLMARKGKVLIAYSDCYLCHREEDRAKGPSFSDIARRYPLQKAYIKLLSRKIISGGAGTWGYPVMSSHPKLSEEEAQLMVNYILSLDVK